MVSIIRAPCFKFKKFWNKHEINFIPNEHELYSFNREKEREKLEKKREERDKKDRERNLYMCINTYIYILLLTLIYISNAHMHRDTQKRHGTSPFLPHIQLLHIASADVNLRHKTSV